VATDNARLGRDFRFLLGGSSVSMLGSRITTVAFPLLVLTVTRSPLATGWCTFAAIAPSALMYIPAGVLVDWWDPRRVMLASALGRWIAVASIVCAIALNEPNLPLLTFAAATAQTLDVFFVLAERRFLRSLVVREKATSLVVREKATSALVRSEARTHLVVLLGRPMGALLLGLNWILPFAVDAVSCLVSIAALTRIGRGRGGDRVAADHQLRKRGDGAHSGMVWTTPLAVLHPWRNRKNARATARHWAIDFRDGLNWLRSHLYAAIGLALTSGTTLVSQALIIVFFAEAYGHHDSAMRIGIVLAASGAGGVVGSAAAAWLLPRVGYPLLQHQMVLFCFVFFVLDHYGIQPYWLIACAMAFLGFSGAVGNIAIDTFMILHAGEKLARVLSIDRLTSFIALALGPALGGALYASGAQVALNVLFAITIVLVVGSLGAATARHLCRNHADQHHDLAPSAVSRPIPAEASDADRPSAPDPVAVVSTELAPANEGRSSNRRRVKSRNLLVLAVRVGIALAWGPAYLLSAQELQETKRRSEAHTANRSLVGVLEGLLGSRVGRDL